LAANGSNIRQTSDAGYNNTRLFSYAYSKEIH
jgi:hypothetical protein